MCYEWEATAAMTGGALAKRTVFMYERGRRAHDTDEQLNTMHGQHLCGTVGENERIRVHPCLNTIHLIQPDMLPGWHRLTSSGLLPLLAEVLDGLHQLIVVVLEGCAWSQGGVETNTGTHRKSGALVAVCTERTRTSVQ